ncbi:alpha/beta fold hydrolase [Microbacterium sp. zg.Y1090]|uniref:lipase family protein n=1 Tax=Microbacterium TaxID=33882 RepID=UPI00214CEA51|nr:MULTISPECIES: lipase family protein [unclassified Microbacterium]MCR2813444.1 alpha/beta fold hydrolase [Microbacterium sp. zg.Y1084]MCR2818220.1 alpha/beta fold hydrolase [Microbacterium sp. zg.Y1090]MDL5486741.1 alpha/beta fold hydrolase [Microbacterium sp. zg-Y1211]WIM27632.1 alpha/beta fold hydrolase [Microbacterium sp. zg-Y1090]
MQGRGRGLTARLGELPRLIVRAPAPALLAIGLLVVALGLLIVFRPLTSLLLLAVYIGLSAVAAGVAELLSSRERAWHGRLFGAIWIIGGLAVAFWFGRRLEELPAAMAVLLIVAGAASLGDALRRGTVSQRVLSLAWGGTQIVFGVLALTWPDISVLMVAVLFGARTIVFGAALVGRGIRAIVSEGAETPAPEPRPVGRRRRVWTAVGRYAVALLLVAAAAGGSWVNSWLADGAPVVDAFYDPPAEVPDGHGRLIRADEYRGAAPPGASVQRILYTTRSTLGDPAVGSALVIVPEEPAGGPRPVVVWNHGTTGIARGCAPSLADGTATHWAIPDVNRAVANGWVVVAPDYSGQGAPGDFPYLIGRGEARSALDAVLAAGELDDDLVLSPRTLVWGHSQGGHAALWTTQLAPDYAPGIDVRGTALLAPAADPLALAEELASGDANALLTVMVSWVLVPYADTYPDVQLEDYAARGAEQLIREISQRCLSEPGVVVSALTALGLSEDQPVTLSDLTTGPLGERLAENVPEGPWGTPLFVGWGAQDDVLPTVLQRRLVDDLCAAGERVYTWVVPTAGHQDLLQPRSQVLPAMLQWSETVLETDLDTPAEAARADRVLDTCAR